MPSTSTRPATSQSRYGRIRTPSEKAAENLRQTDEKTDAIMSSTLMDILTDEDDMPPGCLGTFTSAAKFRGPHRSQLPAAPRYWSELKGHQYEKEFREAADREVAALLRKDVWDVVDQSETKGSKPLPLKWVFSYKFDEDGYLIKFKARLCVRGDLQDEPVLDKRAITLAGRSFRVMMAVAARFNLEIKQFDISNAFLNSDLPLEEVIYCQLPDGYKQDGMVVILKKALYGLRISPLLWFKRLTKAVEASGLIQGQEERCLFTDMMVYLFFYVDDVAMLFRKEHEERFDQVLTQLKQEFDVREEGDINWFLGIRIMRDRKKKTLTICQYAYLEKIARKFKLDKSAKWPAIPIPAVDLVPSQEQADQPFIHKYQEKVGSILYASVMTRPDVSRAASELSKYMLNPSREHMNAADQAIQYLYSTRYLAIQYGGSDEALVVASDASFADDPETRFSSQGHYISLFGGPIIWKAGRQNTVTTSTTEAELLALTETGKEAIALQRLFRDIALDLRAPLTLFCDNRQTIRLIVGENERITTKLRHVDIHNLWARQEHARGTFQVEYLRTNDMPADGLTKTLPRYKFDHFRSMMNFIDIEERLQDERVEN